MPPSAPEPPSDGGYTGPRRILSGIQASGSLHLGNYLGAVQRFVALQDGGDPCFVFVADMHALTAWQDPARLADQTREIAAAYLAAGLDPARTVIWPQSAVHEHAELAWVFNCVARVGWLDRMTQYKDKAGRDAEASSVGLYTYPVLQAADILLYRATHVPVGEDQKQHLELTRDIAGKFNHDWSAPGFFPLPEPLIEGPAARVMSLRDGLAKMSKSDPSDQSRINLLDDADAISKKIKRAKSDADLLPDTLEALSGRPEAANLIGVYAALAGETRAETLARFAGQGFGRLKPELADLAVAVLGPITERMRRLMADPAEVDRVLRDGADRARAVAAPVLDEVKRVVGYWR